MLVENMEQNDIDAKIDQEENNIPQKDIPIKLNDTGKTEETIKQKNIKCLKTGRKEKPFF